jgi:hypothetical protein
MRALFVQAAWVVLVRVGPKHWERYGLKSWIEAAKKRLHHNLLAIALANKLARIAWSSSTSRRRRPLAICVRNMQGTRPTNHGCL